MPISHGRNGEYQARGFSRREGLYLSTRRGGRQVFAGISEKIVRAIYLRAMRRLQGPAWQNGIVLLAYSLLTLLFTYPLAFRIGSALPGLPPDTYQYLWNMEWVRRAIFELGTNPFFTSEIYYPTGVSLYYHALTLGVDLPALPLQLVFGAVPAYMLATLALFALSGYGAYLLALDLIRHRGVAFFVGIVWAFSPYHLSHLLYSHFNLMPLQLIPLFVLALRKLYDHPRVSLFLLALVLMVWTSLSDWYYTLYELLFLGFYSLYRLWRAPPGRVLAPAALLLAAYGLVMSPLLMPMVREASAAPSTFRGAEETDRFSADLLSYFVPSSYQSIWGSAAAPLALKFHGGTAERTLFLGYTVIALAVVGLYFYRKGEHEPYLWLVLALVFFILSLGPRLYVAGTANIAHNIIHLPYELLIQIPGVSSFLTIARSIGRFGLMVMLSASLLAGFGLKALLARISSYVRPWTLLAACCAVGLEFLSIPVLTTPTAVPASAAWLAAQPGAFATLDLPLTYKTGGEAMYFLTVTGKPTMNGYHSRLLPFPIFQGVASLRTAMYPKQSRDIVKAPATTAIDALNFFNVRYVVYHKRPDIGDDLMTAAQWIATNLHGVSPVADDSALTVYPVPASKPRPMLISLDWSGGDPEEFGSQTWRWMDNDAGAMVYAHQAVTAKLIFSARSLEKERHLLVFLNDSLVHQETVPSDDEAQIEISNLALHAGANELRWHSVEPPVQPSVLGINDDPRWLSIAFSRIQVQVTTP